MSHSSQTRALLRADRVAKIKPMTAAAAFGGLVGLAIGCAYLGGTAARATTLRAQAERIQGATAAGFTEEVDRRYKTGRCKTEISSAFFTACERRNHILVVRSVSSEQVRGN